MHLRTKRVVQHEMFIYLQKKKKYAMYLLLHGK